VTAGDWDKVSRDAVFVESKLREWAHIPSSVKESVDVFKEALGLRSSLWAAARQANRTGGFGVGFALALRNPSGHRVGVRGDAELAQLDDLSLELRGERPTGTGLLPFHGLHFGHPFRGCAPDVGCPSNRRKPTRRVKLRGPSHSLIDA
jgi:hypothetical protein